MPVEKERPAILIVDDDDLLRSFYQRIMEKQGYCAITCADGEDAFKMLKDDDLQISLAIIDLLLPFRTGWELIEYMKKEPRYKDVPVVAITGLAASFEEFEKINKICDAVIQKGDFEIDQFSSMIKNLLEKKKSS